MYEQSIGEFMTFCLGLVLCCFSLLSAMEVEKDDISKQKKGVYLTNNSSEILYIGRYGDKIIENKRVGEITDPEQVFPKTVKFFSNANNLWIQNTSFDNTYELEPEIMNREIGFEELKKLEGYADINEDTIYMYNDKIMGTYRFFSSSGKLFVISPISSFNDADNGCSYMRTRRTEALSSTPALEYMVLLGKGMGDTAIIKYLSFPEGKIRKLSKSNIPSLEELARSAILNSILQEEKRRLVELERSWQTNRGPGNHASANNESRSVCCVS